MKHTEVREICTDVEHQLAMCHLSCMQFPCLICIDDYTAGERVDSINHYAGEIRRLEVAILAKKTKILEVCLLLSA